MSVQFPCLNVRLVPAEKVVANEYNPNRVAAPELDLLERSIAADGVTMPIVTFYDHERDQYVIVDGFHRWTVLTQRFRCPEIPVVIIDKDLSERMASTVRHNRARGKHQVDLQAALVRSLIELGRTDEEIARELGMSEEELLRLKQIVGAAHLLSGAEYSASYGRDDEPDFPDDYA